MIATSDRGSLPTVAVVGGGFSGAAVVGHFAERASSPLRVVLYEPASRLARGAAYSAWNEDLLLNVPAGRLSMWPDRPGQFAQWCEQEGRSVEPGAFLSRAWFGEYAQWAMSDALQRAEGRVEFVRVPARVTAVRRDGSGATVIVDEAGGVQRADHVVLAMGNGPTKVPPKVRHIAGDPRLVTNPFDRDAIGRVARTANRVLFIGVGLTMVDAALSLSQLGFKGQMLGLSRRGILPQVHGPSNPGAHADWAAGLQGGDLLRLAREITRRAREHEWRGVIDSLRPHTAHLWRTLDVESRKRFIDRLSVYWDAHRHRRPGETAAAIDRLREQGALRITAAEIVEVIAGPATIDLTFRERRTRATLHERVDAIVLCTGPNADVAAWGSPLIASLAEQGALSRDPNGLGVVCDPEGRLIGADGAPLDWLTAIGPLRKGEAWESTAVPEIGPQAASIAASVLARLGATAPASATANL